MYEDDVGGGVEEREVEMRFGGRRRRRANGFSASLIMPITVSGT